LESVQREIEPAFAIGRAGHGSFTVTGFAFCHILNYMAKKLPAEIGKLIQPQPGRVAEFEFEGDASNTIWVMMTREQMKQIVYDDDELSSNEMLASAATALDDPEGWGAPGMEVYDDIEADPPTS
jgi:hypothetical protein